MKRLIHLLLLQGFLVFTLDASGQNVPVYNIPSPEVASLGTFGTIPVGLFTGTPEISIPLHEVKAGDYTLPISATYHLSSVKPNTPGGPLGLGWNLEAGGFISRTVRFYPDEKKTSSGNGYGYYWHRGALNGMTDAQFDTATGNYSAMNQGTYYELTPDEFSFSFCGYSGNFYLNERGGWTVVSEQDIRLEFDPDNGGFASVSQLTGRIPKISTWSYRGYCNYFFNKFTLITPDGCRYEFGGPDATEYSIPYYSKGSSDLVATTWRLKKITTTEGRVITFQYDSTPFLCDLRYSPQFRLLTGHSASIEYLYSDNRGKSGFSGHLLYPVNLSSIISSRDTVRFTYAADLAYHDHFDDGLALFWLETETRQEFWKTLNDPNNSFFELLDTLPEDSVYETRHNIMELFRNNYLHRMSVNTTSQGLGLSYYFEYTGVRRRKLEGILFREGVPDLVTETIMGGDVGVILYVTPPVETGRDVPEWHFTYNGPEMPMSYVLPRVDAWGYYNGGTYSLTQGARSALPEDPSIIYTKSETLKQINWPTGGRTVFSYELNHFSKLIADDHITIRDTSGTVGGLRVSQITNLNRDGSVAQIKKYSYHSSDNPSQSSGIAQPAPVHSVIYYMPQGVSLQMVSAGGVFPSVTGLNAPPVGYSRVEEETLDGAGNSTGSTVTHFTNYCLGRTNSPATHSYNLAPGSFLAPYRSISFELGKPTLQEQRDSTGTVLRRTSYTYRRINEGSIITPYQEYLAFCYDPVKPLEALIGYITRTDTCSYLQTRVLEEERSASGPWPVLSDKRLSYDTRLRVHRDSTLRSDGTFRITEVLYADDTPGYSWLSSRHILDRPVQTTVSSGGMNLVTSAAYGAANTSSSAPYLLSLTETSGQKSHLRYQAVSADAYGNPTEIVADGLHSTLVWAGPEAQLLTARLDNYSLSAEGSPQIELFPIDNSASTGGELFPFLDGQTPDGHGFANHPQSLITRYVYDGDYRLRSTSDPSGRTVYYDYDALGRLLSVWYFDMTGETPVKKYLNTYSYQYFRRNGGYHPNFSH